MRKLFIVCINKVPARCFDTLNEASAWRDKVINWGISSNELNIYDTIYYF